MRMIMKRPFAAIVWREGMFDRIRVPTLAEVTWHLPEGPFTYWRGRIKEFRVLR
jgi:hypothetical protein